MLMLKFRHSHHHKLTWDKMGTFSLCVLGSLLKLSEIRLLNTEFDEENLNITQQPYMHMMQGEEKKLTRAYSTRQTVTIVKRALDKIQSL